MTPDFYLWTQHQAAILRRIAEDRRALAAGERALVDVEVVKTGDGSYEDGATRDGGSVKIRTRSGDTAWAPEKDVYARKPNPEDKK
jgi:hypothetical protein